MSLHEMLNSFNEKNVKQVVLLCHYNADPDSICSAYAFKGLLKRLRKNLNVEIGTPGGINLLSKNVVKNLGINVTAHPNIEKADIIVFLDLNTIQQLDGLSDKLKKTKKPIIVIDHHTIDVETKKLAKNYIIEENASATCEIIYELFKKNKIKPDYHEAKALFLGIAYDTRHFILAKQITFKIIAKLVESGINVQESLSLLHKPMDVSERIARLKSCKRARIIKNKRWIIATSQVNSYQASAARALINTGAHLAIVAGKKREKIEISFRCTAIFNEKTNIHLGKDIAKPLGNYINGGGGGHAAAAGFNGIGDVKESFKHCLQLLNKKLTK